MLTAETQEKHLLFLCFGLFCSLLGIFFFFLFSLFFPFYVVVNFISTIKSN